MPLTENQKSHLWGLLGVCVILGFFAGLGYFVFWCTETTSVQHFCYETTRYTVADTNGIGTEITTQVDAPQCR